MISMDDMLLYDILMRWGRSPIPHDVLSKAFVIRAQNVADYLYIDNSKEEWLPEDFHNIAPAFPVMWIEFDMPNVSNSEGKVIDVPEMFRLRRGALLDVVDLLPDGHEAMAATVSAAFPSDSKLASIVEQIRSGRDRWMGHATVIAQQRVNGVPMPPTEVGRAIFLIAPDGTPTRSVWFMKKETLKGCREANIEASSNESLLRLTGCSQEQIGGEMAADIVELLLRDVMLTWHHVPFLSLCFMHCKNVTTMTEVLSRPERRRRQREEQDGRPAQTVPHVIVIEQLRRAIKAELGTDALSKKAMHIVRGHFHKYGPEYGKGLLFGKLSGQFYIPAHTAGSVGTPAKNQYDVKATEGKGIGDA